MRKAHQNCREKGPTAHKQTVPVKMRQRKLTRTDRKVPTAHKQTVLVKMRQRKFTRTDRKAPTAHKQTVPVKMRPGKFTRTDRKRRSKVQNDSSSEGGNRKVH